MTGPVPLALLSAAATGCVLAAAALTGQSVTAWLVTAAMLALVSIGVGFYSITRHVRTGRAMSTFGILALAAATGVAISVVPGPRGMAPRVVAGGLAVVTFLLGHAVGLRRHLRSAA